MLAGASVRVVADQLALLALHNMAMCVFYHDFFLFFVLWEGG
jgi:NADH:ubiquinone oxidoreductase subunit 4 (subunit M)